MNPLPSRQVHLDFHTSELMPAVGSRFSARQFQKALKLGRLNSITVFAKCHHSWSYYPTKAGRRHPNLKIDLMGEQIKAAHAIGVRAPIYYTVGWSANDVEDHPEWVTKKRDGSIVTINYDVNAKPTDTKPTTSWKYLDPTGDYKRLMLEQTREICEKYPVDGFFYDICHGPASLSPERLGVMREMGLDPDKPADVKEFSVRVWVEFLSEARAIIRERHPEATVYYNGIASTSADPRLHAQQTHFELEDLPTTWGGYDVFPPRAKFFSNFDKPMLAMSGKFHTMWGEFGGFKHPDAIRYEAAAMIGWGASCSFGDQAHPSGEMDLETYRCIGEAYRYVERIEEYGLPSQPFSNLGVYPSYAAPGSLEPGPTTQGHDQGVANMLMERQIDFQIVDPQTDLSRFETIILTGAPCLDAAAARKLGEYVAAGGSLLVLGESALDAERNKLLLDVGGRYLGAANFNLDYLVVGRELADGLVSSPFLNYTSAIRVKPTSGKVLAEIREPYFNRTYAHYCSHQNTPNQLKKAGHAGALQKGRVILLPHALGKMYYEHGARIHRDLFVNALRRLHRKPIFSARMPSAGRANLVHQPQHRRYVAHLLYAPPLQRGRCLVIEDLVPLRNVPIELRLPEKIKRIRLPLSGRRLKTSARRGVLQVEAPEVNMHEVVVFEY